MRAGMLVLTLLLPTLLVGCLGGDDGTGPEEVRQARAIVNAETGGIEGVVTDVAITPLTAATVTLVELEMTTETSDDGSFAFSEVPPGTYTLEARFLDHLPATDTVTVEADAVRVVDLILSPLVSSQPFEQVFELSGFVECSAGYQVLGAGNAYAVCDIPNGYLIIPENTTNDRYIHFFHVPSSFSGALYEVEWNADTMAQKMSYSSAPDTYASWPSLWLVRMVDTSPAIGLATTERVNLVADRLVEMCEENPESASCGLRPRLDGWDLASRLFAARDCQPTPVSVCAPYQTAFSVYITAYHNQVVDESYAPDALIWNDGDP